MSKEKELTKAVDDAKANLDSKKIVSTKDYTDWGNAVRALEVETKKK